MHFSEVLCIWKAFLIFTVLFPVWNCPVVQSVIGLTQLFYSTHKITLFAEKFWGTFALQIFFVKNGCIFAWNRFEIVISHYLITWLVLTNWAKFDTDIDMTSCQNCVPSGTTIYWWSKRKYPWIFIIQPAHLDACSPL